MRLAFFALMASSTMVAGARWPIKNVDLSVSGTLCECMLRGRLVEGMYTEEHGLYPQYFHNGLRGATEIAAIVMSSAIHRWASLSTDYFTFVYIPSSVIGTMFRSLSAHPQSCCERTLVQTAL